MSVFRCMGPVVAALLSLPGFGGEAQDAHRDNNLSRAEKEAGWLLLFNGTSLEGWHTSSNEPSKIPAENGCINPHGCGGYMMIHEKTWSDFVLALDFKISKGCNSGVFVRTHPLAPRPGKDVGFNGIEIAIDDTMTAGFVDTGAIYDLVKPTRSAMKPVGQWNHMVITCDGSKISVELNGEVVTRMNLDDWTEPNRRPDGTAHKFDVAYKSHPRFGYIGLQDHGSACWYKNIKLKSLMKLSDQLRTLEKEVDDAYAAYTNGNGRLPPSWVEKRWQTYTQKLEANAAKILEIVRKKPGSPESLAALEWIVMAPQNLSYPFGQQAVSLLREHHAENPGVGRAASVIGYYGRHWDEPVVEFVRAVSQRNPDRSARGQAFLGLGRLIWGKAQYVDYHKTGDPAPLLAEAGRLFETVIEKFADCPDLRPLGAQRAAKTLGEAARDELFELRELAVGKSAPDIAGEDIAGQPLKLSDHRGKVVVLNFWASWCGPCMAMVPGERALVERMNGRPFALVGVNGDEVKLKAKKAVETNRMTWHSFWNGGTNGPITDRWNVKSWPTIYVLDDRGVIRFKNLRDKKLDEAVESLVKELEAKQKSSTFP